MLTAASSLPVLLPAVNRYRFDSWLLAKEQRLEQMTDDLPDR